MLCRLKRSRIGWLLLAVSLLIGCLTICWGAFGDEADNLVVGSLMLHGQALYRDLFSHHFPFGYNWAAAVIGLFGKSILAIRLSVWLFQIASFLHRDRLSYATNFASYEAEARRVTEMACGLSDVTLAYCPGNPYIHWFTRMRPVSRYVFMWLWVAEFGLPDVLTDLKVAGQLSLVFTSDTAVWERYRTREYLGHLYEFLDHNYLKTPAGWYVSPGLAAKCGR